MSAWLARTWQKAYEVYGDRRAITLLLLGFFAGLPPALIFSSLSLWLTEAGIARQTVTMFSWAALGYSFKFIWSPLIDSLPVPLLSRYLGQRRAWLLAAQSAIVLALCGMALVDPAHSPKWMAAAAVWLGFSSATQDIVIDAYRVEIGAQDAAMQQVMAATYVAGYRLGMIVSGAGALFIAARFGSSQAHYVYGAWQATYFIMAAVMLLGVATTLAIREPDGPAPVHRPAAEHLRLVVLFVAMAAAFVGAFVALGQLLVIRDDRLWLAGQVALWPAGVFSAFMRESLRLLAGGAAAALLAWVMVASGRLSRERVREAWIAPVEDFFRRYGKAALWLLALIGLYRISDIVAGVISNVFYAHLGFSKEEIATAVKTFGVIMAIAGGFCGGLLAQRFSLMRMMMAGAILSALTNLLFILLEWMPYVAMLYVAVGVDNLAAGLAGAVFVAFLSALTNIRFTAVQYALFSSLMSLLPKLLGGYSGAMVDALGGYPPFFALTAALTLPVLLLVWINGRFVLRE